MKRIAGHFMRTLLWVAVALLVLVAVLVGVARQVVSDIHELQPRITEYLSEQTGWAISVEDLQGSWKGLAPRIRLSNVLVRQQVDLPPAVLLRGLDLEILLLPSLWHLEPRVRMSLDGALLTLQQSEGQLTIEGLITPQRAQTDENMEALDIADLISSQPLAEISDSRLVVKGLYEQPVVLHLKRLKIEAARTFRYLAGDVTLQGPSNLGFQLRGKLRGSLLKSGALTGDFYLDAAQADWLPWIPRDKRHFRQVELDSLQGGGETWLRIKEGRLEDASARFVVHEFNLHSDNDVQPPLVKRMSGLARWQRNNKGGWQAGVEEFRMVTPRFNWQPSVLSVSAKPETDGGTRYGLTLDDADITPWLNYFLSTQTAQGKLYDTLNALRPAGKLNHLSLFMLHKDDSLQDIRLAARLEQFNSRPWEKYPGFRDLDLNIWAHNDVYVLRVDDDYLELNYPYLFRDVLTLKHIGGTVALTRQADAFHLQSGLLNANTDDVRSAAQFSLRLPFDKSVPPFMQLQATLRDAEASAKSRYLPAGIIPPKLLTWLDESILAGQLLRGDILVHGNLGPDQIPNRRILLGFSVQDADLRFLPDWEQPVQQGDADVIVDRGSVHAMITRGEYFDQQLEAGSVDVPRVAPGEQHMLNVQVKTQGPAEQGFAILKETPLAKLAGAAVQDMSVAGEMKVALDLSVPLDKGEQTIGAKVDVNLAQGRFRLESRNLQVDDLTTSVHFDLAKGLFAERLEGRTLGGPVAGTIRTSAFPQGGQITKLDFTGTAEVSRLKDWMKLSVLAPLSGIVPYRVRMDLPLGDARRHKHGYLNITSNLEGTAVELPYPLGKTAKGRSDFRTWLSLDREPSLLGVRYSDVFELSIQNRKGQLQKGMLTLGGEKATLPMSDQFVVQGTLHRLSTDEWLPVIDKLKSASNDYNENIQTQRTRMLDQSRVTIDELIVGERNLGRLQLSLNRHNGGWQMGIDSDVVRGSAELPAYVLEQPDKLAGQTTPIVVKLAQIKWPESRKVENPPPWQPANISPLSLPAADVSIDQLLLGESDYGRWSFKVRPTASGVDLPDVNAFMRGIRIDGNGYWREANGQRTTALKGNFSADDVADVMRGWGSEPTMGSKNLNGKVDWKWPGAPFEFSIARTRGPFDVKLEDGTFYNVESGVVGKFWGALNFETLLRRLQLNFKDLQDQDMIYDDITARGRIDYGMLELGDLALESPAIRLQTKGDIDLNASQLNLVMNVTVPVTRNLVLPAAVVGGVPAAAAAWAVDKVLGSQFDKLTTIKYSVQGSMDAPQVKVVDSFNIIPNKVSETVISGEKKRHPTPTPAPQVTP